ncbi:MAG: type II toxin-antitoxin system VapC family toxin [Bacteroidota bacterium]
MSFLLDTYTLIWAFLSISKLSKSVTEILENPRLDVYASVINYWEISIKVERGKLKLEGFLPEDLPELSKEMGLKTFRLDEKDASSFFKLNKNHHRDPFDRMLIWQAINNNYTLLTCDPEIKLYEQVGLKTFW